MLHNVGSRAFAGEISLWLLALSMVPIVILLPCELNKNVLIWRIRILDFVDALLVCPFWYEM
jgi:hypothetical protein